MDDQHQRQPGQACCQHDFDTALGPNDSVSVVGGFSEPQQYHHNIHRHGHSHHQQQQHDDPEQARESWGNPESVGTKTPDVWWARRQQQRPPSSSASQTQTARLPTRNTGSVVSRAPRTSTRPPPIPNSTPTPRSIANNGGSSSSSSSISRNLPLPFALDPYPLPPPSNISAPSSLSEQTQNLRGLAPQPKTRTVISANNGNRPARNGPAPSRSHSTGAALFPNSSDDGPVGLVSSYTTTQQEQGGLGSRWQQPRKQQDHRAFSETGLPAFARGSLAGGARGPVQGQRPVHGQNRNLIQSRPGSEVGQAAVTVVLSEAPPRPSSVLLSSQPASSSSSPSSSHQRQRQRQRQHQDNNNGEPTPTSTLTPTRMTADAEIAASLKAICAMIEQASAVASQLRGQTQRGRAIAHRQVIAEAKDLRRLLAAEHARMEECLRQQQRGHQQYPHDHQLQHIEESRSREQLFEEEYGDLFRMFFGSGALDEDEEE